MSAENIPRVRSLPSFTDKEIFFVVGIEIFSFDHHFLKLDDLFEIKRNIFIDTVASKDKFVLLWIKPLGFNSNIDEFLLIHQYCGIVVKRDFCWCKLAIWMVVKVKYILLVLYSELE